MKKSKKALILVDLQNDFMPGGALAVPQGDEVIPIANEMQKHFELVIATQDWHPKDHISFIDIWPPHCIQNTYGAEFEKNLNLKKTHKIIHKGTNPKVDSYSAFFDNEHGHHTELDSYLKSHDIKQIYIMGVATDYCVKFSVWDACELGYDVTVIADGCRAIGDAVAAFDEMKKAGAKIIQSKELII